MTKDGTPHNVSAYEERAWEIEGHVMRRLSRMGEGAFGLVCRAMEKILRLEWLRFREANTNQLTVETIHGWFSFSVEESDEKSVVVLKDAMWKYHPLSIALRCQSIHAIDTRLLSFDFSTSQWDELFSGKMTTSKGVDKIIKSVGRLIEACKFSATPQEAIQSITNMWITRRPEGDYELIDATYAVRLLLTENNGILTIHSAELVLEWEMVEAIWPAGHA